MNAFSNSTLKLLSIPWVATAIATAPALACDNNRWQVWQTGVLLCCNFSTLHDVQEFVRMNAGNGYDYSIFKAP
jgi:hypothetical protein